MWMTMYTVHDVHTTSLSIQKCFELCINKSSPNKVVFGLIFIEKTSPTHWYYSHENVIDTIKV